MPVTVIDSIYNISSCNAVVINHETPSDTEGDKGNFSVGESRKISINIPWCPDGSNFSVHHIDVTLQNVIVGQTDIGPRTFSVWQAAHDTDRVRISTDGQWHNPGDEIGGMAAVGLVEQYELFAGFRTLLIHDSGLWLLPSWLIGLVDLGTSALTATGLRITADGGFLPASDVPKLSAVAYSMAGVPSDAFLQGKPEARFMYQDSGKRYSFNIVNGVVQVQPATMVPSIQGTGSVPALTQAISYNHLRRGEAIPLPQFDLIAANGGRIFAKEKSTDRLFFAVVDEMFIHAGPDGKEFTVPGVYFKNDPGYNLPGSSIADSLQPLAGDFAGHPAAIRFPVYRAIFRSSVPALVVKVKRGVWHLMDTRPPAASPLGEVAAKVLSNLPGDGFSVLFPWFATWLQNIIQELQKTDVPTGIANRPHIQYSTSVPPLTWWEASIFISKVLDIGVGHVHFHQQYEQSTGGEIQSLNATSTIGPFPSHSALYQFFNGPVVDLDGFNDGTCNFYMLAQLLGGSVALLYLDEQSYFSGRWRLAEPDPNIETSAGGSLLNDLNSNPASYQWSLATFWSPFHAGFIGTRSRMAVSAQVILVSGDKEPDTIYSINFSWGTMDRTWRWRKLPSTPIFFNSDAEVANEVIAASPQDTIYPQTIRLRDDMTIHIKGTSGGVVGRWYQRYLPHTNNPVPTANELIGGQRPATGYQHHWKFLSETVFNLADQFSHFGVYAQVDSRMQYYTVQPRTQADINALAAVAANPNDCWIDSSNTLFITSYNFRLDTLALPWPPVPPFVESPMRPASLMNNQTLLRVVQRGTSWVALRRDKRDDDLALFNGLPQIVSLKSRSGTYTANVTIFPGVMVQGMPCVEQIYFWFNGNQACLAYTPPPPGPNCFLRLHMAALGQTAGKVIPILDLAIPSEFTLTQGYYQYHWIPAPTQLALLNTYASPAGEKSNGTSLWIEDIPGHVAVPEQVFWAKPPIMNITMNPAQVPDGSAVQVTVHAQDADTGKAISGQIMINGDHTGTTDVPFTYTFSQKSIPISNPEGKPVSTVPAQITATVIAAGYAETEFPVQFAKPKALKVSVTPVLIKIGPVQQVTVTAQDAASGIPMAGRVKINGQDTAATNTPFPYVFIAAAPVGIVSAAGYPDMQISWPAFQQSQLQVEITPAPSLNILKNYIVSAQDADTHTLVDGLVKVDGVQVAHTNTSFAYKFIQKRTGLMAPGTHVPIPEFTNPVITVAVVGYPEATVAATFPDLE